VENEALMLSPGELGLNKEDLEQLTFERLPENEEETVLKDQKTETSKFLLEEISQEKEAIAAAELSIGMGRGQKKKSGIQKKSLLECSICSKRFSKPSDLERHKRTHTKEKPFLCFECGRGFALKSTLESHKKAKHGSQEKKAILKDGLFQCHICSEEAKEGGNGRISKVNEFFFIFLLF